MQELISLGADLRDGHGTLRDLAPHLRSLRDRVVQEVGRVVVGMDHVTHQFLIALLGAGHVLLEGTPEDVDLEEVRRHLKELPEVLAVHDLHAWTLTSELPALTAHVVVTDDCLCDGSAAALLDRLQDCVANHFDVEHSTFQLEAATHADHEPGTHD